MTQQTVQTVTPNGQVAFITGANTGIGRVTATTLALQGYHVVLACRNRAKTDAVLRDIQQRSGGTAQAEFLPLDLGDLNSVRACAQQFLAKNLPLNLLINNAGLAGNKGLSSSGFELTFGVCHVGHFLLTQLLMQALQAAPSARIVVVSSRAHLRVKGIDFASLKQPTQSPGGLKEYCQAKLANMLFVKGLSKRLKGTAITAYALHPGVVATEVWRSVPAFLQPLIKLFMISPEQGAQTTLYCATSPQAAGQSGLYYDGCKPVRHSPAADDDALVERLWTESEDWVAPYTTA
ncbi:SDR family oxidoreductase [Limnobacter humi]|uniref:SDR family oxidoreductase n=1 Tax=Limnobacter humi TaxID=1778671 RepID=A0ABT1WFW0_9BURK|nr:SDR family oxidoreductase [Limnobacter humi]MCQ8896401.1 SDR family oxidoreductase [Limnobacter humi]